MSSLSRTGLIAAVSLLAAAACAAPAQDKAGSSATSATASVARDSAHGPMRDTAITAVGAAAAAATAPPAASASRAASPTGARRVVIGGVDLTNVGYDLGSATAPIVVVELSDFGCPFCGQFARETFPALDSEYVKTGKVYFKYIPFVMGMFPNGSEATRAAECAGDQGKFWPMYERLYAAQDDWKHLSAPLPVYQTYAVAIGVDGARFASCYNGQDTHPRTRLATDAAHLLGVRATPSFLVNGRPIEGALPLADFRKVLSEAAR
jgi:protein-disulfide isomerase